MYSLEIVSKRAQRYRKLAFSFVAAVVLIVASLAVFLLTYSGKTTHTWEELMPNMYLGSLNFNEKDIPEEIHSEISKVKSSVDLLETKFKEFVDLKTSTYFDLIFIGITRIGAILLILYLVKLIVSFTRYLFRVADHYDYVADLMYISENDDSIPKDKLIELMSPKHIVFDGMPTDFQDKTMDILKELVAKK